jgi:hypothetical protein
MADGMEELGSLYNRRALGMPQRSLELQSIYYARQAAGLEPFIKAYQSGDYAPLAAALDFRLGEGFYNQWTSYTEPRVAIEFILQRMEERSTDGIPWDKKDMNKNLEAFFHDVRQISVIQ